jgi:hypothetical protein
VPTLLTNLNSTYRAYLLGLVTALVMAGCGGSGVGGSNVGGGTNPTPAPVDPTTTVAKVILSTTLGAVKSDDSNQSDVTATLLDAGNAIVVGATAAFSSNTGVLIVADAKSDSAGKVIGKFSSGTADPTSRTATIEVSSNGAKSQVPIRINGSTISIALVGTALLPNDASKTTDLNITVKNASGSPVGGSPVTITAVPGDITFTPSTGNTDANGNFTTKAVVGLGKKAGTVVATVSAIGETRTQAFTITEVVSATPSALSVTAVNDVAIPANRIIPLSIGAPMKVSVAAAPPTTSVTFAASLGDWNGGTSSVVTVPVIAGVATATLVSPSSGVASVQVYDSAKPTLTEGFTAAVTAPSTAAAKITVQVAPNIVPKSGGGITGTAFVLATVTDLVGNPVGGAAVAFEIVQSTGGGESISPVVQLTSSVPGTDISLGQAKITFTSGSLPSAQGGVKIRATVVGTTVVTVPDASLTIGGTAGSITFGQATELAENSNKTAYILAMSVQVADSNGNAVAGAKVSLSAWPYAWSLMNTVTPFVFDANNNIIGGGNIIHCNPGSTFLNEDKDENLILDGGEDGYRQEVDPTSFALKSGIPSVGSKDGRITPVNSTAGTLPSVVTTDATGLATFDYIYTKPNSIYTVTRIRASAIVQGTETVSETKFRLAPLKADVNPDCKIPDSPYAF